MGIRNHRNGPSLKIVSHSMRAGVRIAVEAAALQLFIS